MNERSLPYPDKGILQTIYARHSVRAYAPAPVDSAAVHTLLDAAVHAPTAMHEEPWAFVVVQDHALLQRLSDLAKPLFVEEIRHRKRMEPVTRSIISPSRNSTSSMEFIPSSSSAPSRPANSWWPTAGWRRKT